MEQQQRYDNLKLGERGAIISILAYIGLSALKLIVGNLSGSEALGRTVSTMLPTSSRRSLFSLV